MALETISITDPDALPATPGAYLLLIRLKKAIALPPRFDGLRLSEGRYLYAGSAYGPGGIRARCRRHLAARGTRRWHVDWLTHSAAELRAKAFPGGAECALIDQLSRRSDVDFPIPGFGSTDCRRCAAHLVRIADHRAFDAISTAMNAGR